VRPVPGVRAVAGALTLVTTVGGSAAGPLEGLAASLRADDAAAGEARALSAQARVSAAVVGLAPLGYLAFSAMADPASSRVLVATAAGRFCLGAGLVLEALAAWWMRALVRAT
jgi:tight adherence protein B